MDRLPQTITKTFLIGIVYVTLGTYINFLLKFKCK